MRATVIAVVLLVLVGVAAWFLRGVLLTPEGDVRLPTGSPPEPQSTGSKGAAPSPLATASPTVTLPAIDEIEREAREHIAKLTAPGLQPIPIERADHFVTSDQVIALLPETAAEVTTPKILMEDPSLSADAPITVIRSVEQIEMLTPQKLIAESGGDLERRVRVMEGSEVKERTVREVLEIAAKSPEKPIPIVKDVDYYEVTTPKQLTESGIAADESIRVIRKPYRLESATVTELVRREQKFAPDTVFYVRTVRAGDHQGIWGIVHDGLIQNFGRGIAIRRGKELETYRVEIPRDADEKLADQSSSFLGRLIYEKSLQSWVYNFRSNRMGRSPDRIYPGQELVIIHFDPEELIRIYRHFVAQRG